MNWKIAMTDRVPKKVCAIHDLSCVGRCSLTAILPVLSSMGIQVVPLPTALLSTQTGGYEGFTFTPLTDEMKAIAAHWQSFGLTFDSVYAGFLGDEAQIGFVSDFASRARKESGALFLLDPVMGDDGKRYATMSVELCERMRDLAKSADVLTPNLTEACLLLDTDYDRDASRFAVRDMLTALSNGGKTSVVITGIVNRAGLVGACYFDRDTGAFGHHFTSFVENAAYPGTGDVFASVLLGSLLRGGCLGEAVYSAVSYVFNAVSLTSRMGTPVREGVLLESMHIGE